MLQRARIYYHTQTQLILAVFPEVDNPWVTTQPTLNEDLSLNATLREVDPAVLGVLTLLPGQHKEDLRTKVPLKVEGNTIIWGERPTSTAVAPNFEERLSAIERRLDKLEEGV